MSYNLISDVKQTMRLAAFAISKVKKAQLKRKPAGKKIRKSSRSDVVRSKRLSPSGGGFRSVVARAPGKASPKMKEGRPTANPSWTLPAKPLNEFGYALVGEFGDKPRKLEKGNTHGIVIDKAKLAAAGSSGVRLFYNGSWYRIYKSYTGGYSITRDGLSFKSAGKGDEPMAYSTPILGLIRYGHFDVKPDKNGVRIRISWGNPTTMNDPYKGPTKW